MPETVVHPVYSGTALSLHDRRRWSRKCGKYDFGRFEPLRGSSHYLGSGNIGDIEVACRFLFRESRWGILTPDKNPGGVLYLDLTFAEQAGCRLRDATVVVTLNEEDESLQNYAKAKASKIKATKAGESEASVPVHITNHGPQSLLGPVAEAFKITKHYFSPSVDVGGIAGVGGVGRDSEKHYVYESQWKFSGLTLPNNIGKPTILKWQLVENELDSQPKHDNTFHTGFSFEHSGQPFFIQVRICGHLDGRASHMRYKARKGLEKLKFVEKQFATVLVDFGGRENPHRTPLDELAENIPRDMLEKNMKLMPQVPQQPSNQGPRFELIEEDSSIEQDDSLNGQSALPQVMSTPSLVTTEELQEQALALLSIERAPDKPFQVPEATSLLNGHHLKDDGVLPQRGDNSVNSSAEKGEVIHEVALVKPNAGYEKLQQLLRETTLPTVIQFFILWIMTLSMKATRMPSTLKNVPLGRENA